MGAFMSCSKEEPNSLFRSEGMALCQLFLQSESAYSVITELGELGLVQFKDLNPDLSAFQRKYVNEVKQCDDLERIVRFVEEELKNEGIQIPNSNAYPPAPGQKELQTLQGQLEKVEAELREINMNSTQMQKNYLELKELQLVLQRSDYFMTDIPNTQKEIHQTPTLGARIGLTPKRMSEGNVGLIKENGDSNGADMEMADPKQFSSLQLNFLCGTIPVEKLYSFERMLWFVCRGNVFLKSSEIEELLEEPKSREMVKKTAFCLFFQGEQLKAKAKKICEGFKCNLYTISKSEKERLEMLEGVNQRLQDINMVLEKTKEHRLRMLTGQAADVTSLMVKVKKTKAVFHTLNMFNIDVTQKCLIAECWCPVRDIPKIQECISSGTRKSGSDVPSVLNRLSTSTEIPPTFNRTNKFTKAFQAIVDAYGVNTYQEVNPALFSIITFPFIFAIMFGDAGHGIVMFLFALWMVLMERKFMAQRSDNEIWNTFFGGRYIILFMGIFSIYTGLIYNDILSKSVNVFGSAWTVPQEMVSLGNLSDENVGTVQLHVKRDYDGNTYPFGLDPIWQVAYNKITFTNSYKMKMSIVIGVSQMIFGIVLGLFNYTFFKRWWGILLGFIPEMIFISAIFGYMVLLVLAKWLTTFENTSCAPNILVGFINMFLQNYPNMTGVDCPDPLLYQTYDQQKFVEAALVLCAISMVPFLLCGMPIVKVLQNKRRVRERLQSADSIDQPGYEASNEEPFSFGDVMVHQSIHTIEFCLGCVSNTASYLRLWALSLAHTQLSEVLWNMVLKQGTAVAPMVLGDFNFYLGGIIAFVVFAPFATMSVCVLLLMEGLSAFLHALRLHWVEFNSKFYKGEGYMFLPFDFKDVIYGED